MSKTPAAYDRDDTHHRGGMPGSAETEALLPSPTAVVYDESLTSPMEKGLASPTQSKTFKRSHILVAFVTGAVACVLAQLAICGPSCFTPPRNSGASGSDTQRVQQPLATAYAPPWVGSSVPHNYPPTSPTNVFPSMFPTSVGFGGPTPTGAEPALIATAPAYPYQGGQCAKQMIPPQTFSENAMQLKGNAKNSSDEFRLFRSWGNLSPWYSNAKGAFGIDSTPEPPETCRITGLHLLHRHGARYPTQWGECPATVSHLSF